MRPNLIFYIFLSGWRKALLDPRLWLEGSYELGSVPLSVLPSILPSIRSTSFLGIGSLVFLKPCMVLGTHMEMCMKGPNFFFRKNPLPTKMTKNGQKWSKNKVFRLFRKIYLLVLSGNSVKTAKLQNSAKPHMWEISGFQVMAKNALSQLDFSVLWL